MHRPELPLFQRGLDECITAGDLRKFFNINDIPNDAEVICSMPDERNGYMPIALNKIEKINFYDLTGFKEDKGRVGVQISFCAEERKRIFSSKLKIMFEDKPIYIPCNLTGIVEFEPFGSCGIKYVEIENGFQKFMVPPDCVFDSGGSNYDKEVLTAKYLKPIKYCAACGFPNIREANECFECNCPDFESISTRRRRRPK